MQTNKHSHIPTQITGTGWKGRHTTQERDRGFNDHAGCQPCLPIRLGLLLSLLFLFAVERDSLPQQAPVPGSSRQAVLVPSLLRLYRIIVAVYVIYQRHRANRSAKTSTAQHNGLVTVRGRTCRTDRWLTDSGLITFLTLHTLSWLGEGSHLCGGPSSNPV